MFVLIKAKRKEKEFPMQLLKKEIVNKEDSSFI